MIFSKVALNEGVLPHNYYSYLFHNFCILFILVPVETLNVMVLTGEDHFGLSSTVAAKTVANLILFETVLRIFISPSLGILNDRLGRRNVLGTFYLLSSFSIYLLPRVSSIYPGYLFGRILYSCFLTCSFSIPLTGDYIRPET